MKCCTSLNTTERHEQRSAVRGNVSAWARVNVTTWRQSLDNQRKCQHNVRCVRVQFDSRRNPLMPWAYPGMCLQGQNLTSKGRGSWTNCESHPLVMSHCAGTTQMREESESGIRKWEEMWFNTTAEDGEREGGSSDVWWKTVLSYWCELRYLVWLRGQQWSYRTMSVSLTHPQDTQTDPANTRIHDRVISIWVHINTRVHTTARTDTITQTDTDW